MTKHIANIVTGCRIFGSILLLIFPAFSVAFYIIYLFCGFSDMVDGAIARKTNSTSKLGSQLDTIADFIFVAISLFRLWPEISISQWLWIWAGVIAVVKISNIVWGFFLKKRFISMHTIMNKVTGLLLFLLPLTIPLWELNYIAIVVCSIATFSAIQEGFYIITDGGSKQYDSYLSIKMETVIPSHIAICSRFIHIMHKNVRQNSMFFWYIAKCCLLKNILLKID